MQAGNQPQLLGQNTPQTPVQGIGLQDESERKVRNVEYGLQK